MSPPGEIRLPCRGLPARPVPIAREPTFTDFVRQLEPGERPERELIDGLLRRLRGVVVLELKRRSLWHLRPRCLGVFGHASWQESGAVEELVADCYCFVFVERLGSLRAHAGVRSDIDGLVFRSISNFFYDLQKKHDPLGFRLFGVLQLSVRLCCDDGRLHVLAGDSRVRNDTVLGFHEGARAGTDWPVGLESRVESWNDDLLPGLVTARGRTLDGLVARLADRIEGLRDSGIESFAFGRLLQRLKVGARRRWDAIQGHDESDEGDRLPPWMSPGVDFERRQSFEQLVRCVDLRLERLARDGKRAKKRWQQLRRLWVFLRHQAAEHGDSRLLSARRLAAALDIPRDSLPGLMARLGKWVRACRSRHSRGSEA